MDLFFTQRPRVSHRLWSAVSRRLEAPPVQYLRKMGMMERRPVPSSTLDMFFGVHTMVEHPRAGLQWMALQDMGDDYVATDDTLCRECGIERSLEGVNDVCRRCGNSFNRMVTSACGSGTTLGGAVGSSGGKRTTTYMYKRTNHFLDHLKRVQGKEVSVVRPEILAAVENELRKERIEPGDPRITTTKVRSVLKKLKLQKHYVHVFYIASRLSGRPAPTLSVVEEEKLLELFQRIQGPFERHCPPDRTNMLNYSFILRKLTQILEWYDLMEYFPLLKSRNKIYAQDVLWKKICEDAGFPFYKSIA